MEVNSTAPVKLAIGGHGRLVTRAGIALFAVSLANGFLIHALPLPRLALSAHLVGLIGAAFLLGLGAYWPRFEFKVRASRAAAILAVYGFCGGWLAYFSGAALGAGGGFPMASGGVHGTWWTETAIALGMLTIALALFALCALTWRAVGNPLRP